MENQDMKFRFVVIGAADIANKFCNAVSFWEDCEVTAVGSRSLERAKAFAEKNNLPNAYGSYEEMLVAEKPDAAYIAVTTDAHYEMCLLCIKHGIPFLCEKTMCTSVSQTVDVFEKAKEKGIFAMEAMWSRFLPAILKAKEWIRDGKIEEVVFGDINVGFRAKDGDENRFWNPALGGGCAYDLTVYSYDIMTFMIEEPIVDCQVAASFAKTGVDASNLIVLRFENALAALKSSIAVRLEEKMVLDGRGGRIVVPTPHFAREAYLYDQDGNLVDQFFDPNENGFIYEVREVVDCIRRGDLESKSVPYSLTVEFAKVCEELLKR